MQMVSPLAPIAGEILFYFFFKNKKDCTGKRENGWLKFTGLSLQKNHKIERFSLT